MSNREVIWFNIENLVLGTKSEFNCFTRTGASSFEVLGFIKSDMLLNQCLNLKIHYTTCDDSVVIRS